MGFVKHNTDHPIFRLFGAEFPPELIPYEINLPVNYNGLSDLSNDEADGTVY